MNTQAIRSSMVKSESAEAATPTAGARCAFCGHDNPAASKYCNECASDLRLMLCPACAAINGRGMARCHKCGASLVATADDNAASPPSALPVTVATRPDTRDRRPALPLLAGAVIIAAAYVVYHEAADRPPPVETLAPAAASSVEAHTNGAQATSPANASDAAQVAAPAAAVEHEAVTGTNASSDDGTNAAQPASEPAAAEGPQDTCTAGIAALALCDRNTAGERK